MFDVNPRIPKPKVDYSSLLNQIEEKERGTNTIPEVPDDDSVPEAPPGFAFYRIQTGDTLVSLSIKFNVSQNRLRRYNRKICFGNRLGHIVGKLILVPMVNDAKVTSEVREQIEGLLLKDESKQNLMEKEYKEPNENGKYQLRKALMYHAKDLDVNRANYYLGEASWNVRKALELFRTDDKWDKKNRVLTACPEMTDKDVTELLNTYNWDVRTVIQHWNKQKQKEQKENDKIVKTLQKRKKYQTNDPNEDGTQLQLTQQINDNNNNNNNEAEGFDTFKKCC